MKIEYLEDFVVLADTMNYEQAAFRLYTSQSTLSKHIQSLEEELGSPLFTQGSGGSVLTDLGRTFLIYARRHVELNKEFNLIRESLPIAPSAIIKLGYNDYIKYYHIFDAVQTFHKDHPSSSVILYDSSIRDFLNRGVLDLAVMFESSEKDMNYDRLLLLPERFVLAVPKTHRLANRQSVSIKELSEERFLFLQQRCILTYLAKSFCLKNGFSPNIIMTLPNCHNILNMVSRGVGLTMLPGEIVLHSGFPGIKAVEIEEHFELNINIVYDKTHTPSKAENELIQYMIQEVSRVRQIFH